MKIRFPKILLCFSLLLTACSDAQEALAQGVTDSQKGTVLRNQAIHSYNGLPHGFGIGTGTVAEGWINDAVRFWQSQSGTSAIRSTRANDGSKSIYSLNGTRRDSMQRGINIVDGNKVVAK
jgi:hypothetical protein